MHPYIRIRLLERVPMHEMCVGSVVPPPWLQAWTDEEVLAAKFSTATTVAWNNCIYSLKEMIFHCFQITNFWGACSNSLCTLHLKSYSNCFCFLVCMSFVDTGIISLEKLKFDTDILCDLERLSVSRRCCTLYLPCNVCIPFTALVSPSLVKCDILIGYSLLSSSSFILSYACLTHFSSSTIWSAVGVVFLQPWLLWSPSMFPLLLQSLFAVFILMIFFDFVTFSIIV